MAKNTVESIKEAYDRDGYVTIPDVLDAELMQEADSHIQWLMRKHPNVRPENLHSNFMPNDPFWLRLVSDDRLLDIAQQFIGPDIALYRSQYLSKPPFDGKPVLWHQDGSYWNLDPMEVVTLWLAVDDSLPENGCMRVIPGTQQMQLYELQERSDVKSVFGSGINTSLVDESKAVDVILKKGSVSIHHPNVIHGSNANHSPLRRCGLLIRYIPTTTRIVSEDQWPYAFLLRGNANEGINQYLPKPRYIEGQHMPFNGCEAW
ncbi:phytanoyl-CoA dioxygenase family protein [Paenibacillus cremeus]|uniref:Phytanoyl-CoA dioxygenase family protein n=1 Tax=Paenibacillus cremeus TaxID=2163881 RepID=A0A559JVQ7_9BACL|nr:phytanoyl-CoA dioxygenase family protein [Paenibacillus cremeus]TVY03969.1 phytanoyl-CoA dioxygenase family protein [Paenibacillus cremeus]